MLLQHVDAGSTCVADYDGGAMIIGQSTRSRAAYVRRTAPSRPAISCSTWQAIPSGSGRDRRCALPLLGGLGGLLPVALLAVCVAAIVARPRFRYGAAPAARRPRHRRARGRRSTTRSSATATPSPTRPTRCSCWRRSNRAACARPSTSVTSAPTSTSSARWSLHHAEPIRAVCDRGTLRRQRSLHRGGDRLEDRRHGRAEPACRPAQVRAGRSTGLAARPGGDRLHGVRGHRAGRAAARPRPGAAGEHPARADA